MHVLDELPNSYFYTFLPVIHDLGVLILFTLFGVEVLATVNVALSQISPNECNLTREFKIICRWMEFIPIIWMLFYFYDTKTSTKGGWVILNAISGRALDAIWWKKKRCYLLISMINLLMGTLRVNLRVTIQGVSKLLVRILFAQRAYLKKSAFRRRVNELEASLLRPFVTYFCNYALRLFF